MRVKKIFSIVFPVVVTIILAIAGFYFTKEQIKIAEQNNYFTTINNIKDDNASLELLLFAFDDNPQRYKNLLKYKIIKNENSANVSPDIFNGMSQKTRNAFLKLHIDIINQERKKLDLYMYTENGDNDKIYNTINNSFKWIHTSLALYLDTDKFLNYEKVIILQDIEKIIYQYFNSIHSNDFKFRSQLFEAHEIKVLEERFLFLNKNIRYLRDILGVLKANNINNYEIKTLSDKVLSNLSLSITNSIVKDLKRKENIFLKDFYYLDLDLFDEKQRTLKEYHLLSFMHLTNKRVALRSLFPVYKNNTVGEKIEEYVKYLNNYKFKNNLVFSLAKNANRSQYEVEHEFLRYIYSKAFMR